MGRPSKIEPTDASKRKRLTPHSTPTYASRLSHIEISFSIFTRDAIRGNSDKQACAGQPDDAVTGILRRNK